MITPHLACGEPTAASDADSFAKAIGLLVDEMECQDDWDMQNVSVRRCHDRIVALLDEAGETLSEREITLFTEHSGLRSRLLALNERLHFETEIALARKALARPEGDDPFAGSWINRGFLELLGGQVKQWKRCGALNACPLRIAIVGGGALPQTQVYLADALGCETLSIERDPVAADLAAALIARKGLSNASVTNEHGATFDYSGFSIVVVATLVQRKIDVAVQVARSNSKAYFAPRSPVGIHSMWRETLDEISLVAAGWIMKESWHPVGSTVASSVYCHRSS